MTYPKQGQGKSTTAKRNPTPKKLHKNKPVKQFPKKVVVRKIVVPENEYLCKVCDTQVVKVPCGKVIVAATKKGPPEKRAGLGRWKCACGNKTVYVKKVRPAAELKAAA